MKFSNARKITVAAAFVLVIVGLIFNTGTGTLSSFGWQQIAAICPLGVVETFLASKTVFGRALVVLGIALLFFGVFGKVFCAWLCPVPSLRDLIGKIGRRKPKDKEIDGATGKDGHAIGSDDAIDSAGPSCIEANTKQVNESAESPHIEANAQQADKDTEPSHIGSNAQQVDESSESSHLGTNTKQADESAESPHLEANAQQTDARQIPLELTDSEKASLSVSGCTGCAEKRKKFDSRHIVLGGSLLSAAIFGFPVFCLICPIGLTFGTIIIFWQWIGFNDISLSLLIYPAILIVELVVLKKWCSKLCPLGALLSLMSLPNRLFRPKVNNNKCLRSQGIDCRVCVEVCPEDLDPHSMQGMNECSKCGLCIEKCPTAAIALPLLNKKEKASSKQRVQ